MTDLDHLPEDLHDDLHAAAGESFGAPDLNSIMAAGHRIRRRRLAAELVAASVIVIAAGVGVTAALPTTEPPRPAAPAPASSTPSDDLYRVVPTGLRQPGGEIVLQVVPAEVQGAGTDIRFGVMAAVRDDTGAMRDLMMTNEVQGSDVEPGFHAVHAPMTVDGTRVPEFGYYAGPAATITGRSAAGTRVEARLAEAEVGADRIVVFWFDPATAGEGEVGDLAATDAAGNALPRGNNVVGHG
ncbi:hypothetical protein [Catenuloplanes atrovinosus]|uniref:Uncharacterized protein n=1 Tax=Catenuloplanes atrovinosus TaxID=137266 RepID=A0AAE3YT13_9ACTN|nr:hypothetical protein [Catenuloplanes atrovinosus]MDR7278101.1 hypothetical protein [Catenuloplanes atrovinosus]